MAIDLQPNTNYKLVSQDHFNQDKVIVHVKLTDSCLRALQDFKNAKGSSRNTPLIKFSGQNGTITIPSTDKIPESNRRQFTFSCSSLQSTYSQGCLDCIQQPSRGKAVVSLGSITHKMNVNATDDSYRMTRDKMKVVEEERKEVRTRVINMPSKGKKSRNTARQVLKTPALGKRKIQSIPKLSNSPKVSNGPSKSLRDRVIHLLAVRPFKKPELMNRLSKDGVSLKDKNALTNILQQVTSVNNNQYKLLKKIYPEIKVDTWPYSELEKKIVQSLINVKAEEEESVQKSDSNEVKFKEKSNKRQSESTEYANPVLKKQRIAHVVSNNNVTKHAQDTDKPTSPPKQKPSRNKTYEKKKEQSKAERPTVHASSSENDSQGNQSDYRKKYLPITNNEQRCSYKRDFQVEYQEYQKLQNQIDSVTRKFEELKENLRNCPQQSTERTVIEKEIRELYQKQVQDPTWETNKRRCKDLHCKLTHIKALIREYDDKRVESPAT